MSLMSSMSRTLRQALGMVIPYKDIASTLDIKTPLSQEMQLALLTWHSMYTNHSPWAGDVNVKSLNLAALVSSELSRQITLESEYHISSKELAENGHDMAINERSEYLTQEFQKLWDKLRQKVELGMGAGGILIKPYPRNGHIYFDCCPDWEIYPLSFDDDGNLDDVIFPETYAKGNDYYTRLERHTREGDVIHVTQKAYKSSSPINLGTEIPLTEVDRWAGLEPEATVNFPEGMLFGWFKVAMANNVDVECPMGVSCFSRATEMIKECDLQYSRLSWEFEGSELAIDVDPTVLRPSKTDGKQELPRLNQRLFRAVDIQGGTGEGDFYKVFSPSIRDQSIINGLNHMLQRVEDLCGLSRGSISQLDHTTDSKTATELRIMRQRSYATVADNQTALDRCLKDVVKVMDFYATAYQLAPEGSYECSFEWDDSILVDTEVQLNERLTLLNAGAESKVNLRRWYFGETEAQAKAAIAQINDEEAERMTAMSKGLDDSLPTYGNPVPSTAHRQSEPNRTDDSRLPGNEPKKDE